MGETHLVVDGSNIATEGRSLPSLVQLQEAVAAFLEERKFDHVTVVVDATFGHRIDASERDAFEAAIDAGELLTPPAGVIGRGDAFILEIADRAGAVILSNDSFQEFHGGYEWLFTEGRLIGGKPVRGVGWIFLARSPVRGPASRRAVSDARKRKRADKAAPAEATRAPANRGAKRSRRGDARAETTAPEPEQPTRAAVEAPAARPRRGAVAKEAEPYNAPLPFIEFVGAHPVGSKVWGEVERFSSHGAYVMADGTRCYVSLKNISDPPPRSAREVLDVGDTRQWLVQAIDTPRRGVDLALVPVEESGPPPAGHEPAAVVAAGEEHDGDEAPAPEPVAQAAPSGAEPAEALADAVEPVAGPVEAAGVSAAPAAPPQAAPADAVASGGKKLSVSERRRLRAEPAAAEAASTTEQPTAIPEEPVSPNQEAARKKAPAKKTAAKRTATRSAAKKTAAEEPEAPATKAPARKAAAKKSATKAPAEKATAKKSATKAPAERAAAKKSATKAPAEKATAKKATAKKTPAKKTATRASSKKAAAETAAPTKAAARKAAPTKAAKKVPSRRAPVEKSAPAG